MSKINENRKPFYNGFIPVDWRVSKFGSEFEFLKTFSYSRAQLTEQKTINEIQNIHYGDIHSTFESEILDFEIDKRIPYLLDGLIDNNSFQKNEFPRLKDGDLIIADASEDYEGICDCIELKNTKDRKVVSGLHTFAARIKTNNILLGFRTYILNHQLVKKELGRIATGISVYGVSKTNLSKVDIALPPLSEQKTIAEAFYLMDKALNKTSKLIIQKELRKKWLMQNLLMGKKRLKGFDGTWEIKKLKDILTTAGKPITPIKDELYQQIGIRSHTKGIFYKDKVTGEELGNKRVFEIEADCFVVNIVFAWEHAIAKTTSNELGMIASHRFPMYKPKKDILDLDYLLYYFKSPRGKYLLGLASPGGAGRNKTLGKSEFMKLKIPVPSVKEQKAIAQILQTADKEIELLQNKLEKLKEQKKGMMQVLLTGKKRLKIS